MWPAVLVASAMAFLTKWAGHLLPEGLLERPLVRRAAGMLPIALLAALTAIQTFWSPDGFTLDARVAGVAVAIVALLLRAPFLVVVLAAAATAALLRAAGLG
ncbi:MAG TPA: AzlD domain-containing protein [Candidatus Nanopelagicales bacterium]